MNAPQLRDIHLPDVSLWWPPAPGWWILLLLLIGLPLLLPWLWRQWQRWRRQRSLSRVSLQELDRIRECRARGEDDRVLLNRIAVLLRRVSMSYYGRRAEAATTGAEWTSQLQRLAPDAGFSPPLLELLARDRYRADCTPDIDALLLASERWLKMLPRRPDVSA